MTIRGVQLADDVGSPDVLRVEHRNSISFVRNHENAAVRTILGVRSATIARPGAGAGSESRVSPLRVARHSLSYTRRSACRVIQVEPKNALTFVKALLDIVVENSVTTVQL